MPRIVTLTTDFGTGSSYVAEMKGRLLHAVAPFTLIDITHDVPPYDVRFAAWVVGRTTAGFPAGSLHVVVIDPGVGTSREIVWARIGRQEYLAPDNGVLSHPLRHAPLLAARTLTVPHDASATFHGRDVVAVAACRLLDGDSPETLGPARGPLATIVEPEPTPLPDGLLGEVRFIDYFGNLITNLPASLWPRVQAAGGVFLGERWIDRVVRTYGDAASGEAVVLVGSQGVLEIAIVERSAARLLGSRVGTPVRIADRRPRS